MAADGEKPQNLTLTDIVASVNDASMTARNVTTAMLGTAVTLAATILASTDEAILRDQLTAPFGISATIKLHVAYALMPLVFLFLHVNGLLQLHVLTERIELFDKILQEHVPEIAERDRWRRRLHGFAFVQYFTDDEQQQSNVNELLEYIRNSLLWMVNQLSISWVPLLILIGTQVSFLRYQSVPITLLHETVVLLDVGFIVWFQIAQSRYLRRPTERPAPWVFGLLLFFAFFWLLGLDPLIAVPLLVGLAFGRIAVVLTRFLGKGLVWWSICVGGGVFLAVLTGASSDYLIGWFFGLLLAALWLVWTPAVRFAQRSYRWIRSTWAGYILAFFGWMLSVFKRSDADAPPDRRRQLANFRTKYWLKTSLAYGTMPVILVWFTLSQAQIAAPDETACEVRWNWELANKFSEPPPSAEGEEVVERTEDPESLPADSLDSMLTEPAPRKPSTAQEFRIWNAERTSRSMQRLDLTWNQIMLPVASASHVHCLTEEPAASAEILDGKDGIFQVKVVRPARSPNRRANLLDRLSCPKWSVGCRYLSLPSRVLVSESKAGDAIKTLKVDENEMREGQQRSLGLPLRERNLRFARMEQTYLYGADLRDADLTSAELSGTHLQFAIISSARLRNAQLDGATFDNVDLTRSGLQNVRARGALFRNSILSFSNMQGAVFDDADLRGATFDGAQLQGASFARAHLEGVSFSAPIASDAYWKQVMDLDFLNDQVVKERMRKIYQDAAVLDGVVLDGAHMEGATLIAAKLTAASLRNADLSGASLDGAALQGANLSGAGTLSASFAMSDVTASVGLSCVKAFFVEVDDTTDWTREAFWSERIEPALRDADLIGADVDHIKDQVFAPSGGVISASVSLCRPRAGTPYAGSESFRTADWADRVFRSACRSPEIGRGVVRNLWILISSGRQVEFDEEFQAIVKYAEPRAQALYRLNVSHGEEKCFSEEDAQRLKILANRALWP